MYEVARREKRADADRYRDAAMRQARWVVETLDPADPAVTKGQRMSEHMTITGLTTLLREYPQQAPAGLKSWLAKWADVVIVRSENPWDFRRYDDREWSIPRLNQNWNEPGNVAGFPACALSVAELLPDAKSAARLREIAVAHWDDLYGRNPLGAHAAYRGARDFPGVERGWPKKFSDDTCARLELVRGSISSTAATEHYPYNPAGPFRHPEGWTAFNAAFNVALAYASREGTRLTLSPSPSRWSVDLSVPVRAVGSNAAPAPQVTLRTSGGDAETVTATATPGSETNFRASMRAVKGKPVPGDGVLQVGENETVTASYGFGIFARRIVRLTGSTARE